MSGRARVYIAVAAVIVAAAVPAGLIYGSSAGASTTACGSACTSPTVQSLGTGEALAVSGSSVVMSTANTTSSTEDWTPESEGTVGNASLRRCGVPGCSWQYDADQLVEYQYAPNGVPSDECLADTASVPLQGPSFYAPSLTVALEPCGITAQSLWILDASNGSNGYVNLVNAGYAAASAYDEPENASSNDDFTIPFAEPSC